MPTGRTAFQRKPPLYGHYAAIRQTGEQFMDQATLMDKIKTGTTLCKAIMRNGYDAYAINAPLQGLIFEKTGVFDVDIACACDTETLFKIFPNAVPYTEEGALRASSPNSSSRASSKAPTPTTPKLRSSKTSTRPEASSWSACRARRSPRTTCSPSVPCATRRTSICPSTRTRG